MAKPLIQMALDSLDFDQTVALATQVAPYVDIFEIGTPCIKHNGINLVKELKARFPDKIVVSRSKNYGRWRIRSDSILCSRC